MEREDQSEHDDGTVSNPNDDILKIAVGVVIFIIVVFSLGVVFFVNRQGH